jgi:uncharacterized protein
MNQPEALYHLQEIDLGLLRCQKRLAEITTALTANQAVAAAQERRAQAESALKPLRVRAKNLELENQTNAQKAKTTEAQLYSGRVKNPKELQDMEHEIAALKKRNVELDDELLEVMVATEEADAAVAEADTSLRQATAAWEAEHTHLLDEQGKLQAEVTSLQRRRIEAVKTVTPENLKYYETMRPKKNHQVLALMKDGSCTACGVRQTMAIEREVRQGEKLVACENCGRILVYK